MKAVRERNQEGYPVDWQVRAGRSRLIRPRSLSIQDLVSRFTLDSASEFLFGQDVRSLSVTLPYPPDSPPARSPAAHDALLHPANKFSREFLEAQIASATRSRYTQAWPLWEFWQDKAALHMRTIDEFIGPLCREALRQKAIKAREGGMD